MLESLHNNVFTYKKLTEEEQQTRGILGRLVGVIADTKRPTRNGRQYSESLWENVFNDPIMQEKIEHRCCFGEFGHPTDREEVDPEKIAICLAEVPKVGEDGLLYGVFDILNTPCGKILKAVCDYGTDIGVSSRGSGDIIEDDEVDPETYNCECWDAVLIPAVKVARTTLVTESYDRKAAKLRKTLNEELSKASDEDRKVMESVIEELNINLGEAEKCDECDNKHQLTEDEDADFSTFEIDTTNPLPENEILEAKEEDEEVAADDNNEEVENEEECEDCGSEEVISLVKDVADIVINSENPDEDIEKLIDEKVENDECSKEIINKIVDTVRTIVSDCSAKGEAIDDEAADKEDAEVAADENAEDKVEDAEEDVIDDEADEVIENLKEAIRQKDELENEVKDLRNEKTVSDIEVNALKEELNKYKVAFDRTSAIAAKGKTAEAEVKKLTEQLNQKENVLKQKDGEIASLKKSQEVRLTESVSVTNKKIKLLTESLNNARSEVQDKEKQLTEQANIYKQKLSKAATIANKYKEQAEKVVEEYINYRASMLGVRPAEIKNKLNESYTLSDVNAACDDILCSGMPAVNFGLNRNAKVRVTESKQPTKQDDNSWEMYDWMND